MKRLKDKLKRFKRPKLSKKQIDILFLEIVKLISKMSDCQLSPSGCLVKKEDKDEFIIGCKRAPDDPVCLMPYKKGSDEDYCPVAGLNHAGGPRKCIGTHAAISCFDNFNAENYFRGGTMYITRLPCVDCAEKLAKTGLKRIVFFEPMYTKKALNVLKKAKIKVNRIKI
jgi:deoxycytidylate deaminase